MSNLPESTTPVYCVDEDILVRASGDYLTLCPSWQSMGKGSDGVFANGSPWVLSSASVNFGSNNVQPNQVVALTEPKAIFRGGGDILAIDSISTDGTSITLRRAHQDLNVGSPPAPLTGLSNVAFSIVTMGPQIEEASFDIKRRFAIDEALPLRNSAWVYDLRDLRILTVLTVLYDRYTAELRGDKGDWVRKMGHIRNQREEVLARVTVRWGPFGNDAEPASASFGQRMARG